MDMDIWLSMVPIMAGPMAAIFFFFIIIRLLISAFFSRPMPPVWIDGKEYVIANATHWFFLSDVSPLSVRGMTLGFTQRSLICRDPSGDWYVRLVWYQVTALPGPLGRTQYDECTEWRVITPVALLELLTTHTQYGHLDDKDRHTLETFAQAAA